MWSGAAFIMLLFFAPAGFNGADTTETDPLSLRLTLEHLLEVDPTDPIFIPMLVDRDPVGEEEIRDLQIPRSSLTLGFGLERGVQAGGGGSSADWTGSPPRGLIRMDLRCAPGVAVGATCEKDAGERLDLGFCSAYLACAGLPLGGEMIVGDYRLRAGCGLVAGGGVSPMGMAERLRGAGRGDELAPHRSRDEFSFLRGLALRFAPARRWRILLFSSRRTFSASGEEHAPSLSTNSLFRTAAEIGRRGEILERIAGGRVALSAGSVSAGVTLSSSWFSPALARGGPGTPEGSRALMLGADFTVHPGPFLLSGEIARSPGGGFGVILLASIPAGRYSYVAAGVQALAPEFVGYRSAGAVTPSSSNDVALRILAQVGASSLTQLRCSLVQHWTPSIPSSRNSLSAGWSGSVGGSLGIGGGWRLDGLLRFRRGDDELSFAAEGGGREKRRVLTVRNSARVSLRGRVGRIETVTLLERARSCDGSGGGEEFGEQLHEECVWRPVGWLGISFMATLFSSDSYAARTTSLEEDPISRIQYVALDGEGFRWVCAMRVAPPLSGMTLLLLLSGEKGPGSVSTRSAWGVRTRWTW